VQVQRTRELKSAKTARARRQLSAPAQYLLEHDLLTGRILDFGCGRGDLAKFLSGDIEQYDPNWHPQKPRGKFDVVTCIYVLNVLRPVPRRKALVEAKSYVRRGGRLYVAVRRDIKRDGERKWGTEQYNVTLSLPSLVKRSGSFEIYEWSK